MQQRAGRSRRHHGSQKPSGKRELRALGKSCKGKKYHRDQSQARFRIRAYRKGHQILDIDNLEGNRRIGNCHRKAQAAQQVHPQGLKGILHGLIRLIVANQQEGTDTGDFPEEINPDQIAGENQPHHGSQEQKQHTEEKVSSVLVIQMVSVVILHISNCVHTDQTAYYTDDQTHGNGQLVRKNMIAGYLRPAGKLQPGHQPRLRNGQQSTIILSEFKAVIKYKNYQRPFHYQHQHIDTVCVRQVGDGLP